MSYLRIKDIDIKNLRICKSCEMENTAKCLLCKIQISEFKTLEYCNIHRENTDNKGFLCFGAEDKLFCSPKCRGIFNIKQ